MAAITGFTAGPDVDGVAAAPDAETDMGIAAAATFAVAVVATGTDIAIAGALETAAPDAEADARIAAAVDASAASKEHGGGGGSSLSSP
jgi:hypothetical protein